VLCLRAHRFSLLFSVMLLATQLSAQGAVLYVNRAIVAAQGDIELGAIVYTSSPLSAQQTETMSRSVTILGESVQYLTTSLYMSELEKAFGEDAIIVGSRTVLIPKGSPAEGESYLVDRMGDFLKAQGLLEDSKVELSFSFSSLKGAAPHDGIPSIQAVKKNRGIELAFVLTDSQGNSAIGRATCASTPSGFDSHQAVELNSPVRVIFRKGPITVEVPGSALSDAAAGENVNVFIAESQKTFTGRVIDSKVVQVDIP
jgi:hypothetical protein